MLILASSSPRRAQILTELGIPFLVDPADVDETLQPGESADAAAAGAMLRRLAGREHRVVTGVSLRRGTAVFETTASSIVRFAPMSADEIAWYVGTGEPRDKAGAYGVQ